MTNNKTTMPQPTGPLALYALTLLAMLAFAGNSLLCRLALKTTPIDAASFTALRLASGALVLWLLVCWQRGSLAGKGDWPGALALFAYAAGFSFAYLQLAAGLGALLLFGAVQATMIGVGLYRGERLRPMQTLGLIAALGGVAGLLLPGAAAADTPPLFSALLMLGAGIAWGVYSLRGRGVADPTGTTAGNFLRATPLGLALLLVSFPWLRLDPLGATYALASGAIASGLGYALWYRVLRGLTATRAASVQLSVPALTALAAVAFLGEPLTLRLVIASVTILGGVGLVIAGRQARQ